MCDPKYETLAEWPVNKRRENCYHGLEKKGLSF